MLTDASAAFGNPSEVEVGIDIDGWSRWVDYICLQADRHSLARWLEEH